MPGPIYCDASALVKLYLPEPESGQVNRLVQGRRDLIVSDLAVTEIVSSIARRWRDGVVDRETVTRLQRVILADLDGDLFQRADLTPSTHREAERLLLSLSTVPLRAADALHLALAVTHRAMTMLTFDRRLADAAQAAGLQIPLLRAPRASQR